MFNHKEIVGWTSGFPKVTETLSAHLESEFVFGVKLINVHASMCPKFH